MHDDGATFGERFLSNSKHKKPLYRKTLFTRKLLLTIAVLATAAPLLAASVAWCLEEGVPKNFCVIPTAPGDVPNLPQPATLANGQGSTHAAIKPKLIDDDPWFDEEFGKATWHPNGEKACFKLELVADDTYKVNASTTFQNDDDDNCIELKVTFTYWYPIITILYEYDIFGEIIGATQTTTYDKWEHTVSYSPICECP